MILRVQPGGRGKTAGGASGQAESIDGAASFEKLGIDPKGAVYRVSYRDIGADVRQVADVIDKIGAMAPMFLGMAAANAKPEELKPVQEAIGLLPSWRKWFASSISSGTI